MTSYGKFDEYVKLAVNDSEKASEVVARSFYRILRKNGFSNAQIFNVANNILDCLIETLDSYKERTEEKKEKGPDTDRDTDTGKDSPAIITD